MARLCGWCASAVGRDCRRQPFLCCARSRPSLCAVRASRRLPRWRQRGARFPSVCARALHTSRSMPLCEPQWRRRRSEESRASAPAFSTAVQRASVSRTFLEAPSIALRKRCNSCSAAITALSNACRPPPRACVSSALMSSSALGCAAISARPSQRPLRPARLLLCRPPVPSNTRPGPRPRRHAALPPPRASRQRPDGEMPLPHVDEGAPTRRGVGAAAAAAAVAVASAMAARADSVPLSPPGGDGSD